MRVAAAAPITYTVVVEGFGTVRAQNAVTITPEVSGRVVFVNSDVQVGRKVSAGDVLVRLDGSRYETIVAENEARLGQLRSELERLQATHGDDQSRVSVLQRSREIARTQFQRAQTLLAEGVGNQLEVDRSEQAYNEAADRFQQLQSVLNTYPMMVDEAEKRLAAAESALARARLDLGLTELRAPFTGRVESILTGADTAQGSPGLAEGHYADAGRPMLVLSDTSVLEIPIKLDARDAHEWLPMANVSGEKFASVVECEVAWTEDENSPNWRGTLNRIENYDSESRTVTAVVAVASADQSGGFPLAEGMFCSVRIPGRVLEGVFEVPQSAIGVDGSLFVSKHGRLESRQVHVVWQEANRAFVDEGLNAGDLVITTRLVNPIERALLRVAEAETALPAAE